MLDSEIEKIKPSLRIIHTEADYDRTVKMMNTLLGVTGDDEDHPLSGLLDLTSDLVSRYEQEHHPIEAAEPKGALQFLCRGKRAYTAATMPLQCDEGADFMTFCIGLFGLDKWHHVDKTVANLAGMRDRIGAKAPDVKAVPA